MAVVVGSIVAIAPSLVVLAGCVWRGLSPGPQDVRGSEGDGLIPYAAVLVLLFGCFQIFVLLPVRVQVFQETKTAAENYIPPTITVTFTPATTVTTNHSDVQGSGSRTTQPAPAGEEKP